MVENDFQELQPSAVAWGCAPQFRDYEVRLFGGIGQGGGEGDPLRWLLINHRSWRPLPMDLERPFLLSSELPFCRSICCTRCDSERLGRGFFSASLLRVTKDGCHARTNAQSKSVHVGRNCAELAISHLVRSSVLTFLSRTFFSSSPVSPLNYNESC